VLPRPSRYFAVVRDPVDRIVSSYYYVRSTPHNPLHKVVSTRSISFREFVEERVLEPADENFQTRVLAGAQAGLETGSALLERAKRNIEERFLLAGTLEHFDETVLLLRDKLGWRRPPFHDRRNEAKRRPDVRTVPSDIRRMIEARNELDIELHRFVQERLDEEVRRAGALFPWRVRAFSALNSMQQRSPAPVSRVGGRILGMVGGRRE
jgi:hypothetical protein